MTNKEAIKVLEWIKNTHPEHITCEAIDLAVSALEKQETAKIVVGKTKGGVTLWHECSKCGEPGDAKDIFCRRCGRKLIYETE